MLGIQINNRGRFTPVTLFKAMNEEHDLYLRSLIRLTTAALKDNAPVKRGKLRESIDVIDLNETRSGDLDRRFSLVVAPTVYYAKFVIGGAGPSKGRYVKKIDKRLKFVPDIGIHPGNEPNETFLFRAAISIEKLAAEFGESIYGKWEDAWRGVYVKLR